MTGKVEQPSNPVALWGIAESGPPLVAAAIHDGHAMRQEVAALCALDDRTRLREEDPYTRLFTRVAPSRIIGLRSRFEIDLNRPRDEGVCNIPEACWGLEVWRRDPSPEMVARSLDEHDAFYSKLARVLSRMQKSHGGFVVLDIHAYNHRRYGPDAPPADPRDHPDVNVGTGSLDRTRWGDLVDGFLSDLRDSALDARENVLFKGRRLAAFVHEYFPQTGCCLAIEFKKTFMDEWTGQLDRAAIEPLIDALSGATSGVLKQLRAVLSDDEMMTG